MSDSESPIKQRKTELLESKSAVVGVPRSTMMTKFASEGFALAAAKKKQLSGGVPDEVKLSSRLTSAYLCERRTYFSSTKYLLYIKNEQLPSGNQRMCIVLQATRNENDRTLLPLYLVANVEPDPDGDQTELFTIEMDPSHGQTLKLFSRERDRILTEIALEQETIRQQQNANVAPLVPENQQVPEVGSEQTNMSEAADLSRQIQTQSTPRVAPLIPPRSEVESFQMEHRRDFFFQEQEQSRRVNFTVHRFGICAKYQQKDATQSAVNDPILINLNMGAAGTVHSRQHSRQMTRGGSLADLSTMQPTSLWIMFTDIDFVYIPTKDHHSAENQGQNSIMYIVKKNKEVEKFVYNNKDLVVAAINQNCSKLLGRGINLKKTTEIARDGLADGNKHFSVDDQALIRYIWRKELALADHTKPISDDYRMLLEFPTSYSSKDKEVILRLYSDQIWILQRLKQRGNENDAKSESIIFAAKIDTLTKCVLCSTNEITGEPTLSLCLTFHQKERVLGREHERDANRESSYKDSYRDIYLRKPKDGKELAHHKKKMSELIALILLLREESVNKMINEQAEGVVTDGRVDNQVDVQVLLNRIQVLPLPERPLPYQAVMGCLPMSVSYMQYQSEPLGSFTVDPDYEQGIFRELIRLFRLQETQLADASWDIVSLDERLRLVMREICENCNFYSLKIQDDAMMQTFVRKLVRLIDDYERLEAMQVAVFSHEKIEEYHESELDTASEDERDSSFAEGKRTEGGVQNKETYLLGEYQTSAKVVNENQDDNLESFDEQDVSGSRNNESLTKGVKVDDQVARKKFNECSESLARMLLILQRVMQSGHIFASQLVPNYQKLERSLLKLLKVDNFLMTYLSSQCIVSMIQFADNSQVSNEQRNKHLFVRDKINMMKYLGRHLSYHDRCLKLRGKVMCHMSMKVCADLLRALFCNRVAPHFSQAALRACLPDHENYAQRKPRQRTNGEQLVYGGGSSNCISNRDMASFVKTLCDNDYKLLHIIERFSLMDHLVMSVSYGRLITELLDFCYQVRDDPQPSDLGFCLFGQLQYRLFAYSVNMLVQVETLMKGRSTGSRTLDSSLTYAFCTFTMLMKSNQKAVQVLQQIFKKFLFRQVSTFANESSPEKWGQAEWYNFFVVVRNENSRRASDFWDDRMRQDCLHAIRAAINRFNQDCLSHIKPILCQERVLTHLAHEFSETGQLKSKVNHLKWNFEEFSVTYSSEAENLKIWRYYLRVLVVEKTEGKSVVASLHESFDKKDAKKLWDHLLEVFVPEQTNKANFEKRQLILKCLILLYRSYPERIGPVKLLPYWLRLLQDLKERSCYFLVLQLILVALDAPPRSKEAIANAKIFEEANGLEIIVGCLNFGYKDLQDSAIMTKMREIRNAQDKSINIEEPVEEFKDSEKMFANKMQIDEEQSELTSVVISAFPDETAEFNSMAQNTIQVQEEQSLAVPYGDENQGDGGLQALLNKSDEDSKSLLDNQDKSNANDYTVMVEEHEQLRVNYTKTIKSRHIFQQNSESVNLAILAFTILDFCMSQPKNKNDNPISKGKNFLLRRQNVAVIVQLLFLQNVDLLRCILKFVYFHFKSTEALRVIKDSGVIEFLILLLDNKEDSNFDNLPGDDEDIGAYLQTMSLRTQHEQDRAEPQLEPMPATIAECAFQLINKIQEAWGEDCNADFGELQDHFDSNDRNVLEQHPELKQSLLLRYVPLPMIIKSTNRYQQPGQEDFLDVFQHDRFQQATIIWKAKMRTKLYDEIIKHNSGLLEDLESYFDPSQARDVSYIRKTDLIPLYRGPLQRRIEYQNIEKEVKCGKYYLRIWVNNREKRNAQKSVLITITIPEREEENYLENLKNSISGIMERLELEKLDEEDSPHWKEINDLTYTLKACLYAGETFKLKHFNCMDQVINLIRQVSQRYERRVPEKTKTDFQQILMLSLQIIHTMINPERKDSQISKNRQELVEKAGIVELHEKIIGLIYEKAQKKRRDDDDGGVEQKLGSLQKSREVILRIFEANILRFAVLNTDIIVQCLGRKNPKEGVQTKISDSFALMLNFTKILVVSDNLYKGIESLLGQNSANWKLPHVNESAIEQEPELSPEKARERNTTYAKTDLHIYGLAKSKEKEKPKQQSTRNRLTFSARTTRSSTSKTFSFDKDKLDTIKKTPKDDLHRQVASSSRKNKGRDGIKGSLLDKNYPIVFDSKDIELAFKRGKKTEAPQGSSELYQMALVDEKFLCVINLAAAVIKIGLYFSKDQSMATDLIRTGFLWRVLQFIQFSMQRDLIRHFGRVDQMIDDCCLILLNIASKAAETLEDSEAAQSSHQDYQVSQNDQILIDFNSALARLLPMKIFETLQATRMKIGDRRFDMQEHEYRNHAHKFRKLFSLEREATPELIWESQMRDELRQVLCSQLDSILLHSKHTTDFKNDPNIFKHLIDEFVFTVDTNELKIDEIFVKHFNDDIFFRPPNILQFVDALVGRLRQDTVEGEFTIREGLLTQHSLDDMFEITKALHNLIQYQNALNTTNFQVDQNITLFCKILGSQVSTTDENLLKKVEEIKEVILEMLVLISQDKEFAPSLLKNLQFVLLVAQIFNKGTLEGGLSLLLMQRLTHILLEIWEVRYKQKECEYTYLEEFNKFFNKDGIIIFCIKAIMNRQQDPASRRALTFLVQQNIIQDTETFRKVGAVFPVQFLNMRSKSKSETEEEEWRRARDFLSYLDQEHFENQFVIWTTMMRNGDGNQVGLYQEVTRMCDEIVGHLEAMTKNQYQPFDQNDFDLDDQPTQMLIQLTKRNMEHEVVVDDIILRIFNQDPTVQIQRERDFGLFIQCLIIELTKQTRTLELIRQKLASQNQDISIGLQDEAEMVNKEKLVRLQKYVANQTLLVTTSLILCIEQVVKNETNQNFKEKISEFKMNIATQATNADLRKRASASLAQESAQADELDRYKKLKLLPMEHLARCVIGEIDRLTLSDKELPVELRVTFLQLVNLVFSVDCSIVLTKKDKYVKIMASQTFQPKFVNFMKKLVVDLADDSETTTLEGNVTLALLAAAVHYGGQRLTSLLFEDDFVLQMLKKISFQFTNLEKMTTYVMSKIARIDPKVQRDFLEEQKQTSGHQHEKWSKILNATSSLIVESSGVEWRGAAINTDDAAVRYRQSAQDHNIIEEKLQPEEEKTDLDQTMSTDLVLPLIGKDAIQLGKVQKILEHSETELPLIDIIKRQALDQMQD